MFIAYIYIIPIKEVSRMILIMLCFVLLVPENCFYHRPVYEHYRYVCSDGSGRKEKVNIAAFFKVMRSKTYPLEIIIIQVDFSVK